MIFNRYGEGITTEAGKLCVGDKIIAIDSDYAGLKGCITEIRTGTDKDTENETDDVYCEFDVPETEEGIKLLEEHFSELFQEPKTIDDICLDLIIMAPEELKLVIDDE